MKDQNATTGANSSLKFSVDGELLDALVEAAADLQTEPEKLIKIWTSERLSEPPDDIDYIRRGEESAYYEMRDYLGAIVILIQELVKTYRLLSDIFESVKPNLDANQLVGFMHCLQASRYQMLIGNLASLRAHPADHSLYRRRSIEFCAFALQMGRDATHAKVWNEAVMSKKGYDRYLTAFSINQTITGVEDLLGKKLKKAYSELGKQVHASPYAVASQVKIIQSQTGSAHVLEFFQLATIEQKKYLALSLLNGLELDFLILTAYAKGLEEFSQAFNTTAWVAGEGHFRQELSKVKSDWANVLDPGGYYRSGKIPPRNKGTKQ